MTELNAPGNWEFFDLHNFGSKVNGYAESVFDGRFVYYGPERNYTKDGVSFEAHCFFLRFDTQKPFSDPNSWQLFDGREIYHLASGSVGLAFDGRFIYYVPFRSGGANKYLLNSVILRYDITKNYLDKKSWEYFDLSCIDSDAGGFVGSCFFNGKIYMAPYYSGDKSLFLVYNTKHAFCSKTSWEKNDLLKINQNAKGYIGCLGIKKYIYFSPCYNDQKENSHGVFCRLNTEKPFLNQDSWEFFDGEQINNSCCGYDGLATDGKFVYFAPYYKKKPWIVPDIHHGLVARYNTEKEFHKNESWECVDLTEIFDDKTTGYIGAGFDGRRVYFAPVKNKYGYHGNVVCYDTLKKFNLKESWERIDLTKINLRAKYYDGRISFCGAFMYFAACGHDAMMARFRARK